MDEVRIDPSDYRILKVISTDAEHPFQVYELVKMFYSDQERTRPDSYFIPDIEPEGATFSEFKRNWEQYNQAFLRPALIYDIDLDAFTGEEPAN